MLFTEPTDVSLLSYFYAIYLATGTPATMGDFSNGGAKVMHFFQFAITFLDFSLYLCRNN